MEGNRGGWFEVRRPARAAELWRAHLPWAALAGAVLALARFFPFREHRVISCAFRKATGLPCPSCGYTRAFCDLAHGDVARAWAESPAALLAFAAVAAVFLWHAAALASGRLIRPGPRLRPGPKASTALWVLAALIYLSNWAYRLATGRV